MAITGTRSTFNKTNNYTLDTFKEMFNLSASEVSLVNEWKTLKSKFNRTDDDNNRLIELNNQLSGKIVTSEDWNKLLDAMYNLEQSYIDKGLDRVEALEEVIDSLNSTSTTNPLSANQGRILDEKDVGLKYKGSTYGEIFNAYSGNKASGNFSHAEGNGTTANGDNSHAEGHYTTALGVASHASGESNSIAKEIVSNLVVGTDNDTIITAWRSNKFSLAKGDYSNVSGANCLALGDYSHAEGNGTQANGDSSHAEGHYTTASYGAHSEGGGTKASGDNSHAEGGGTEASGSYSHSEGNGTTASGDNSHAEGNGTTASEWASHAEGDGTEASGSHSHAEGFNTKASGDNSHAEGYYTIASGRDSHAEGYYTIASGRDSHAEGYKTKALGNYSHASGKATTANSCQFVTGKFNTGYTGCTSDDSQSADETIFIVGCGTSTATKNALRITANGSCKGTSAFVSSGADYAEYFEWFDGNPNNEDRRGYFVTFDGEKIRKANAEDDFILGIVSGAGAFIGNSASEDWCKKYLTDVFGTPIKQIVEIPESIDENTGELIPAHTAEQFVINPDYDPNQEYISREFRKEWSSIGLLGKLVVIDDGTCEVNGYCSVGNGGIATLSENGYRVLKRIDDSHISILFK